MNFVKIISVNDGMNSNNQFDLENDQINFICSFLICFNYLVLLSDVITIMLIIGPFFVLLCKEIEKRKEEVLKIKGGFYMVALIFTYLFRIVIKFCESNDLRVLLVISIDNIKEFSKNRKTLLSDIFVEDEDAMLSSLKEIIKSTDMINMKEIDRIVCQSNLIKSEKINSQLYSTLSLIEENKMALKSYQYQINKDLNDILENFSKDSIALGQASIYSLNNSIHDKFAESDSEEDFMK